MNASRVAGCGFGGRRVTVFVVDVPDESVFVKFEQSRRGLVRATTDQSSDSVRRHRSVVHQRFEHGESL